MKKIEKYQTLNGALHDTVQDAQRHLKKLYGDHLLAIGRNIANSSYTNVTEYIDSNLDLFVKLKAIKDDMKLEIQDV